MGRWLRPERAPEYDGVMIDMVILDKYLNQDKAPKLSLDYIDKISRELNIAPYDIGRVLGWAPHELSTKLPVAQQVPEEQKKPKPKLNPNRTATIPPSEPPKKYKTPVELANSMLKEEK